MNNMIRTCVLITAIGLLGLAAHAQAPAAPAKPEPDIAATLKQILDNQRALDAKVVELQKRLDSISTFLGDQRASTFDAVDRPLRDIEDELKRLSR